MSKPYMSQEEVAEFARLSEERQARSFEMGTAVAYTAYTGRTYLGEVLDVDITARKCFVNFTGWAQAVWMPWNQFGLEPVTA